MYKYLTDAAYLRDYKVYIKFNTGEEGVVSLEDTVGGKGIFKPLKDLKNFSKVEFSKELDTICWPNGADLAPEYLYQKLRSSSEVSRRQA